MPHNPSETHCTKCDAQLIHSNTDSFCPICDDEDDETESPIKYDALDMRDIMTDID